jgi:AcrR family transcriptional regulator
MVDASRAVVELFLKRGTSDISVKALAAHAGISERTFYRYFPRKEDAIRPSIDEGIDRIVSLVRARSGTDALFEVLVDAYATVVFHAESRHDWQALGALLHETDSLRAVWLQVVTDSERVLSHVVAEWLSIAPDSARARMAGAAVVTAARVSLETLLEDPSSPEPGEVFAQNLGLLGSALFTPAAPSTPHAHPRRRK